jgi:hypothetical protein
LFRFVTKLSICLCAFFVRRFTTAAIRSHKLVFRMVVFMNKMDIMVDDEVRLVGDGNQRFVIFLRI